MVFINRSIILLNGSSRSGKSSLSIQIKSVMEDQSDEKYHIISVDDYFPMSVEKTIYEEDVFEASGRMCEEITRIYNSGNIIVDHVITSTRIFLQLVYAVKNCHMYMIHVYCPVEELRRREQQ